MLKTVEETNMKWGRKNLNKICCMEGWNLLP